MLDIQFIRDNRELVEKSAKAKNINVDIDKLLKIYDKHGPLLREVESLRAKSNEIASRSKTGKPDEQTIKAGKKVKAELTPKEEELRIMEAERRNIAWDVPNVIPDDTPLGGEEANKLEKKWGEPKKTKAMDHVEWSEKNGLIDFERGAKVAGNKFYFLKGQLVELELAIIDFSLKIAKKYGFTPITVPHLVSDWVMNGTGFLPRGEEKQIYKIADEDLNLIATAEIPLTGYHADEIIEGKHLPELYVGLSPAYRREAGAYGKHSKGLFRVHQFNKVELYVFCKPEESEKWHKKLLEVEEEICQTLKIPYQVVRIAAGDLGASAYKKYDIEYWSPAEQAYRELMSCSNVTDYQARRLNIRYKDKNDETKLVHTLNATAAATGRLSIAIIENYQTKDGSFEIPDVLKPYLSKST